MQNLNLISSCSIICPIQWSQMLSWEWRCSWSSANRRCSNYIWVISTFIPCKGASFIRGVRIIGSCWIRSCPFGHCQPQVTMTVTMMVNVASHLCLSLPLVVSRVSSPVTQMNEHCHNALSGVRMWWWGLIGNPSFFIQCWIQSLWYVQLRCGCTMVMSSLSMCPSIWVFQTFVNMFWDVSLKVSIYTLTLSQWYSSGNPVSIQCAWNLDPVYTGMSLEKCQCASSGLPVAFQWSSSVFQLCKLTLDRHWDTTGC